MHIARVDAKFLTAASRRSWIRIALFEQGHGAQRPAFVFALPTSHVLFGPASCRAASMDRRLAARLGSFRSRATNGGFSVDRNGSLWL